MIKRTTGEKIFNVFNYIFLGALAFVCLYPFLYTVSISFSTLAEASKDGLHLFPVDTTLRSYQMVFADEKVWSAYLVTILRTVTGTVFSLLMTTTFAYALSRRNMPHRNFWTFVVVFTMLFSGGTIPSFLVIHGLKLTNNFLVYILPTAVGAYNLIIMKNAFMGIPESLYESAKIDGANEWTIWTNIYMPLSKATIAVLTLWISVGHCNAWIDSLLYMDGDNFQVLQMYLRRVVQDNQTELILSGMVDADVTDYNTETVKSATIVVAMLPILCVYPFIQKYFVKGIMLGSVKG